MIALHIDDNDILRTASRGAVQPRYSKDENYTTISGIQISTPIHFQPSPSAEEINKIRSSRQVGKGPMLHYDEPWSHDHRCKKG
ncbi:hypothetical protein BHM03_00018025 [Ensete ventricosum]|nr:hypothetical protein BHM03_00018025 [Ensete ventricosum]